MSDVFVKRVGHHGIGRAGARTRAPRAAAKRVGPGPELYPRLAEVIRTAWANRHHFRALSGARVAAEQGRHTGARI